MKVVTIAGLGWIPIIALALWWAGFAPFPTKPIALASYQTAEYCTVATDNWANCSPKLRIPPPHGSESQFRLFSGGKRDSSYGEYHQWGVEGFNGCWDAGCAAMFHPADPNTWQLQWKIYNESEVPHFGLGAAKWVLTLGSPSLPTDGVYPEAAYTTYGACMYRKPADTGNAFYWCRPIEAGDAWHVGTIEARKP